MTGAEARGRAPVLALIGDRYHNVDYIRVHFDRLFSGLGIDYDYTANYEWFSGRETTADLLARRRLFCVFRDGLVFPGGYIGPEAYSHYIKNLIDDPPESPAQTGVSDGFGEAVEQFVQQGGALFAWHNSLSVSQFSPAYRRVSGGAYDGHPPERNWVVHVARTDHPLTQGVRDFVVTDEQHFPVFDGAEGDVLLRGVNRDGLRFTSDSGATRDGVESVVAWARPYGAGRVVTSTIGHNLAALWQPEYLVFQANAIRWLLDMR